MSPARFTSSVAVATLRPREPEAGGAARVGPSTLPLPAAAPS